MTPDPFMLTEFAGHPAAELRAADGARAVVLLHGGHVVSWQPAGGAERLFLSERARFGPGAPIRGGVPVIFPQFNERGPLPRHGFVRTRPWLLSRAEVGADDALAVLQFTGDAETRTLWPHAFALELTVCVRGGRLDIELAVSNIDDRAFEFMAGLHTYLRVAAVEATRLTGLHACRYEDFVTRTIHVDAADAVRVDDEIDRIYFGVDSALVLDDGPQRLRIESAHFPEVVVWNPWESKGAAMTDLSPGDFRRFLCVEAALIERPVRLAAGEHWWGRQTLIAG